MILWVDIVLRSLKENNLVNHVGIAINSFDNIDDNLDYHGEKQILKVEGLLATCVQHECDHLDGKLMLDYLSKLKKTMILKKLSKQKVKSARIIV